MSDEQREAAIRKFDTLYFNGGYSHINRGMVRRALTEFFEVEAAQPVTGTVEWGVLPDGDKAVMELDDESDAREWVRRWPQDKLYSRRIATEWEEVN